MQITVRFFALLRDRAGVAQTELILETGASVAIAADVVASKFPALATLIPRIGFAINQMYVNRATVLHDGDELALIPPVSGGACG